MELFIKKENQEMLWRIIHHIPIVNQMEYSYKVKWFKSIIENIYESDTKMSSLREINKKTVEYICFILKRQNEASNLDSLVQDSSIRDSSIRNSSMKDSQFREEVFEYTSTLQQREKEYEKMLDKTPPNAPIFESIKDEPIANLEELVKNHELSRGLYIDQSEYKEAILPKTY